MKRSLILIYGVLCYVSFLGVFLYAIGFISNCFTPTALDASVTGSLGTGLFVDVAFLILFAAQHSLMARASFKRWLTKIVPTAAERSTYVLFTNIALALIFWLWRPLGGYLWHFESETIRIVLYSLASFGWLIVLVTTFLISHTDLFGLRQVWLNFRRLEYTHLTFRTTLFYGYIRHPLYVGWFIAFWATPTMTVAHFVFALGATLYILAGVRLEERDLALLHPEYVRYKKRVPQFMPFSKFPEFTVTDDDDVVVSSAKQFTPY